MFSYEIYKSFQNIYFEEHLQMNTSQFMQMTLPYTSFLSIL